MNDPARRGRNQSQTKQKSSRKGAKAQRRNDAEPTLRAGAPEFGSHAERGNQAKGNEWHDWQARQEPRDSAFPGGSLGTSDSAEGGRNDTEGVDSRG